MARRPNNMERRVRDFDDENSPRFSKKQFVTSRKYAKVKDFLNGNLEDDKLYTIREVDKILKKLYNKVR